MRFACARFTFKLEKAAQPFKFAFPIWRRQPIANLENQVKPLIVNV